MLEELQRCVVTFLILFTLTESTSIWPQPKYMKTLSSDAVYLASNFKITTSSSEKNVVEAIERYAIKIESLPNFGKSETGIHELNVTGDLVVENVSVEMNESYELIVNESKAMIKATTFFGMLRGLESTLQMLERDDIYDIGDTPPFFPTAVHIQDSPRFSYRGLMMDLSRHFYEPQFLEHVVDSLVLNKMNVLHLHITDDQSFPIESLEYPELTQKGSFGPDFVYSVENMSSVVQYAFDRGVIIVPEFDMPAHASSWGAGKPDSVVTGYPGCSPKLFTHGDTLDPTKNETYDMIRTLLNEMVENVFDDGKTPYVIKSTHFFMLQLRDSNQKNITHIVHSYH